MKTYEVKLPITGWALVEVEAESEADAIKAAFDEVTLKHVEEWEAVERIVAGNVVYALRPWNAEVTLIDTGEA